MHQSSPVGCPLACTVCPEMFPFLPAFQAGPAPSKISHRHFANIPSHRLGLRTEIWIHGFTVAEMADRQGNKRAKGPKKTRNVRQGNMIIQKLGLSAAK